MTDAERDPSEVDILLIAPVLYQLCPDCEENGYDRRPGGSNPPPKTASIIPRDFQDLERREGGAAAVVSTNESPIDEPTEISANSHVQERAQSKPPAYTTTAPSPLPCRANQLPNSVEAASSPWQIFRPSPAELSRITKRIPLALGLIALRDPEHDLSSAPRNTHDRSDAQIRTQQSTSTSTLARAASPQKPHPRVRFVLPPYNARESGLEERIRGATLRPRTHRSPRPAIMSEGSHEAVPIPPPTTPSGNSLYPGEEVSAPLGSDGKSDCMPPYKAISDP